MDSENVQPTVSKSRSSKSMKLVKYSLTALVVVLGIYAWGYIYTKGANAAGK